MPQPGSFSKDFSQVLFMFWDQQRASLMERASLPWTGLSSSSCGVGVGEAEVLSKCSSLLGAKKKLRGWTVESKPQLSLIALICMRLMKPLGKNMCMYVHEHTCLHLCAWTLLYVFAHVCILCAFVYAHMYYASAVEGSVWMCTLKSHMLVLCFFFMFSVITA